MDAHLNIAIALIDQGNAAAAANELKEFIRLIPDTPTKRPKIDLAKKMLKLLGAKETSS